MASETAYLVEIGGNTFTLTFHGVRGSTPCHGESIARYGGNTSCVSLDVPGHDPVLFDLGTGLRYFGLVQPSDRAFRGTCFLSHLHWDHVQGLPFFTPLLRDGAHLDVYAPTQDDGSTVTDVIKSTICPPLFPVGLDAFPGSVSFLEVDNSDLTLGEIEVMARTIPHLGVTCGYRVTWNGRSVTYMSDHQQPTDGSFSATDGALELCAATDVLIHDAQFTPTEFAEKSDWGHCMIEYAVWLAAETNVRRLVLFHHDPSHDDDRMDELAAMAAGCAAHTGVEVIAAREGLTLTIGE